MRHYKVQYFHSRDLPPVDKAQVVEDDCGFGCGNDNNDDDVEDDDLKTFPHFDS